MTSYEGVYIGVVEAVYPPKHKMNRFGNQYQYQVLITGENQSALPTMCIKMDSTGNVNDFEDATLSVGGKVLVVFPRRDPTMGIIIGGVRRYFDPTDDSLGHHWQRRFNEIVQSCDKQGAYTVRSIDGPFVKIEKKKVTISNVQEDPGKGTVKSDDSEIVESIVFDSAAKTLTVTARELKIQVKDPKDAKGNVSIEVSGNATIGVKKNAAITVNKSLSVESKGNTVVKAKEATIEASGDTTVEGKSVKLGKKASESVVKGDTFKKLFDMHIHPTVVGPSGPPTQPLAPNALSKKVKTE